MKNKSRHITEHQRENTFKAASAKGGVLAGTYQIINYIDRILDLKLNRRKK